MVRFRASIHFPCIGVGGVSSMNRSFLGLIIISACCNMRVDSFYHLNCVLSVAFMEELLFRFPNCQEQIETVAQCHHYTHNAEAKSHRLHTHTHN